MKAKIAIVSVVLSIFSVGVSAEDKPFGFKDIRIGDSFNRYSADKKYSCKSDKEISCVRDMSESLTIAGSPILLLSLEFTKRKQPQKDGSTKEEALLSKISIQVDSSKFETVTDALHQKYGTSKTSVSSKVSEKYGSGIERGVMQWEAASYKSSSLGYGQGGLKTSFGFITAKKNDPYQNFSEIVFSGEELDASSYTSVGQIIENNARDL